MKAFEAVASTPWCIQEEVLATILEIAARENPAPEAVAAKLGRPLDNTRNVTVRDGVAILPITGPIFRYANLFTEVSGATATGLLAREFTAALEDPKVRAILLEVDSPGGECTGINELSDLIFAARGRKPILAYVSGSGASAAYWIASAADEIVASPTAMLGSIGTVMAYRDTRARDEKAGVQTIEIVSSQSPNKRPDPNTEGGREQIRTLCDAITEVFVAAVARNRRVSVETVLEEFGAGGMFVGAAAVEAGLADRLSSFEEALEGLVIDLGRRQNHRAKYQTSEPGRTAPAAQATGAAAPQGDDMDQTMLDNEQTGAAASEATEHAAETAGATATPLKPATAAIAGGYTGGTPANANPPMPAAGSQTGASATPQPDARFDELQRRVAAVEAENAVLKAKEERATVEASLSSLRLQDGRTALAPASRAALADSLMKLSSADRKPVLEALQGLQVVELGERGFRPDPASASSDGEITLSATERDLVKTLAASMGVKVEEAEQQYLETKRKRQGA